jgi:hypothetical protein
VLRMGGTVPTDRSVGQLPAVWCEPAISGT